MGPVGIGKGQLRFCWRARCAGAGNCRNALRTGPVCKARGPSCFGCNNAGQPHRRHAVFMGHAFHFGASPPFLPTQQSLLLLPASSPAAEASPAPAKPPLCAPDLPLLCRTCLCHEAHLHLQLLLAVLQPLQRALPDEVGDVVLIFRQPVQRKRGIVLRLGGRKGHGRGEGKLSRGRRREARHVLLRCIQGRASRLPACSVEH